MIFDILFAGFFETFWARFSDLKFEENFDTIFEMENISYNTPRGGFHFFFDFSFFFSFDLRCLK